MSIENYNEFIFSLLPRGIKLYNTMTSTTVSKSLWSLIVYAL
ncbi:hypothetical protein HanPSC8_Chr02g0076301 [Helianthus annuus]|nr:hypothetical protein HanPSC8_Chr02g0076301 [Helianthus annuus]